MKYRYLCVLTALSSKAALTVEPEPGREHARFFLLLFNVYCIQFISRLAVHVFCPIIPFLLPVNVFATRLLYLFAIGDMFRTFALSIFDYFRFMSTLLFQLFLTFEVAEVLLKRLFLSIFRDPPFCRNPIRLNHFQLNRARCFLIPYLLGLVKRVSKKKFFSYSLWKPQSVAQKTFWFTEIRFCFLQSGSAVEATFIICLAEWTTIAVYMWIPGSEIAAATMQRSAMHSCCYVYNKFMREYIICR